MSDSEIIKPEDIVVNPPEEDIPGVKYEVAQKIEKMLQNGRRYFGSSGASLTHQVHNPEPDSGIKPELAKVGLEGERSTTKFLQDWMKDKPGAVLIDSVHINMDYKTDDIEDEIDEEKLDEESGLIDGKDTDHVLLIGDEVILIDTKRWKSKRKYSVSDNGSILRSNKTFPGGQVKMKNAIYLWLEYLYEDAVITGMVLINTDEITVIRNYNWYNQSFRLVELARFEELLNERWKNISDENKTSINSTLVSQVALSAIKPFDEYSKVFDMEALHKFK